MKHRIQKILLLIALLIGGKLTSDYFTFKNNSKQLISYNILENTTKNEAIVVLTGEKHRIPAAIELLRKRNSPLLIISGAYQGTKLTDIVNRQRGSENAQAIWGKIVLESKSTSTIENAKESAKIIKEKKIDQIILVTSDFHLRRSFVLFKKYCPEVKMIPYSVDFEINDFSSFLVVFLEFWKSVLLKYYFYYLL